MLGFFTKMGRTGLFCGTLALLAAGCAGGHKEPRTAETAAEGATPAGESVAGPTPAAEASPTAEATSRATVRPKDRRSSPCSRSSDPDQPLIDEAQRKLYETLCGAALWFDGLFGERNGRTITSAKNTSGRLEISGLNSDYDGTKLRVRGNVRFDFPNLDRRLNAFIGRDDQDDFIRDRSEGLALRSQFIDFADQNRWLAGLGYSLPGTYREKVDFRVGGKLGSEPEIFAQGRYRRNFLIDKRNLFHFRETMFWTNRDGFGSTTSFDYDHVVKRTMLLRWGSIGTVSESTDGFEWRSALLLYQSLRADGQALAYETFIRGETANEVPLTEWGARMIYRQPLLRRDWLAGEVVLGYSWPRYELEDARDGSLTVGLGLEILVGKWK